MNRPAFDFSGKTVLVTGGTSGMGAATVEAFARSGARVVFAGRNEARAGSLLERIRQFSIEAHFVAGDITEAAYCQHLVDETSSLTGEQNGCTNRMSQLQKTSECKECAVHMRTQHQKGGR